MMITQERLKELLHYDPETGVFTWKVRSARCIQVGDEAGSVNPRGYRRINVEGKTMLAHRLAVLYMDGYLPEHSVDHIKRNKDDNRYKELREATNQCQLRNAGMLSSNKSGVKGVYWHIKEKKWASFVYLNAKFKSLGHHKDFDEAVYHRYAAEQFLEFPDQNSSAKQFITRRKVQEDLTIWGPM